VTDAGTAALELNVAIRTFQITGGRTHLGVGAGITVDSDPAAEWRETELKAARLLAVAGAPGQDCERIGVPA
jgi:para-aminobenzoate synthetase component I